MIATIPEGSGSSSTRCLWRATCDSGSDLEDILRDTDKWNANSVEISRNVKPCAEHRGFQCYSSIIRCRIQQMSNTWKAPLLAAVLISVCSNQ